MMKKLIRWFDSDASTTTPLCVLGILFGMGCTTTTMTRSLWESRTWEPTYYQETVTVRTEPSGARIYVQDEYVGVSPVQATLKTDKYKINQTGWYTQQYNVDGWAGRQFGHQKIGTTNWGDLTATLGQQSWVIKAFMEGYEPASRTLTIGPDDANFRRAMSQVKPDSEGRLTSILTGERTVLLSLREIPGPRPAAQQGQQQQQQQQTVVVPGRDQPEVSTTGRLIVTSTIEGADIYVDGLFVGNAPANLTLTSGVHIIEVKRRGYHPFRRELRVLAGSEITLRAELERED